MKRLILLISFSILMLGSLYLYSNQPWLLLPEKLGVLHFILFFVLVASTMLVLAFNKTRIFFILLLFLGTTINIEYFDYLRHTDAVFLEVSDSGFISDAYILFVFPIFITIFALSKERGLLSTAGLIRLGITFLTIGLLDLFVFNENLSPFSMGCEACGFVLLPQYIPLAVSTNLVLVGPLFLLAFSVIKNSKIEGIYFLAWLTALGAALSSRTLDVFILFAVSYALLSVVFILSHSYVIAFIDELTNIKGRRAMTEYLQTLSSNYTMVMGDIDHFKSFNDTHGHDIGDEVLKLVASELNKVSGGGKAFRWGGEEFVIVFNHKNIKEAKPYVETLRQAIEKRPFVMRGEERKQQDETKRNTKKSSQDKKLFVTMSFGMAIHEGKEESHHVLKKADNALYKAKEGGRNCVRS